MPQHPSLFVTLSMWYCCRQHKVYSRARSTLSPPVLIYSHDTSFAIAKWVIVESAGFSASSRVSRSPHNRSVRPTTGFRFKSRGGGGVLEPPGTDWFGLSCRLPGTFAYIEVKTEITNRSSNTSSLISPLPPYQLAHRKLFVRSFFDTVFWCSVLNK